LILGTLMIVVSFKDKFRHWWSYVSCSLLAIACGMLGVIGTFFSNLLYSFPNLLLPLDYLFLLQAGVVLGIACLSYEHAAIPDRLRLPRPSNLFNNLAFPVPKTLQSPTGSNPRGAQPA
jgi:hypothetical protein